MTDDTMTDRTLASGLALLINDLQREQAGRFGVIYVLESYTCTACACMQRGLAGRLAAVLDQRCVQCVCARARAAMVDPGWISGWLLRAKAKSIVFFWWHARARGRRVEHGARAVSIDRIAAQIFPVQWGHTAYAQVLLLSPII